jgi:two-component system alkaline phosphatase synthesis response regulator PhoP
MKKILLIDDDVDFLEPLKIVLSSKGFFVETATTPDEGIEKVKETNPDLVVLDVMMPNDYEGFEVAKYIREDLGLKELPILILSNIHHVKKVPYRFAPDKDFLPVDVFIDKPVDPDVLIDNVNKLLGEKREEPKTPL